MCLATTLFSIKFCILTMKKQINNEHVRELPLRAHSSIGERSTHRELHKKLADVCNVKLKWADSLWLERSPIKERARGHAWYTNYAALRRGMTKSLDNASQTQVSFIDDSNKYFRPLTKKQLRSEDSNIQLSRINNFNDQHETSLRYFGSSFLCNGSQFDSLYLSFVVF